MPPADVSGMVLGSKASETYLMPPRSSLPTSHRCANCAKLCGDAVKLSIHIGKQKKCRLYYDNQSSLETSNASGGALGMQYDEDLVPDPTGFIPDAADSPSPTLDEEHPAKRPRVTVEEVDDETEGLREVGEYPATVAEEKGLGVTMFENMFEDQQAMMETPWTPFRDKEEWELSQWMMKRVNQTGIDEFLKLPIVSVDIQFVNHTSTYRERVDTKSNQT